MYLPSRHSWIMLNIFTLSSCFNAHPSSKHANELYVGWHACIMPRWAEKMFWFIHHLFIYLNIMRHRPIQYSGEKNLRKRN
jgi:hypothetical protein